MYQVHGDVSCLNLDLIMLKVLAAFAASKNRYCLYLIALFVDNISTKEKDNRLSSTSQMIKKKIPTKYIFHCLFSLFFFLFANNVCQFVLILILFSISLRNIPSLEMRTKYTPLFSIISSRKDFFKKKSFVHARASPVVNYKTCLNSQAFDRPVSGLSFARLYAFDKVYVCACMCLQQGRKQMKHRQQK